MTSPFITVLIPAYKSKLTLPTLLASLLNQTNTNFEVVVFDNSPIDLLFQDADLFYDLFKKRGIVFRFFHSEKHLGVGGSVNYLLKKVTSPYFLQIDSDDALENNAIEQYIDCAIKYEPDLILTNLCIYDEQLTTLLAEYSYTNPPKNWIKAFLYIRGVHFTPLCVRTDSFVRESGGLAINPSKYGQNYQLLLPALLSHVPSRVCVIDARLHKYRFSPNSLSHRKKSFEEIMAERKGLKITVSKTLQKCRNARLRYYAYNLTRFHGEMQSLFIENRKWGRAVWHSFFSDWPHKKQMIRALLNSNRIKGQGSKQ